MVEPAAIDIDEEKPLDPEVENIRRRMMRLLFISFGSMLIGLMAVFGAIVYKINTADDDAAVQSSTQQQIPGEIAKGSLSLPKGTQIITSNLSGSQILLTVKYPDESLHLIVFDVKSGKMVADYTVTQ